MSKLPRVQVLMATYNGAVYLREQIDSVLVQEGVEITLLVRDDGSSDGTPALIREYEARYPGRVALLDDDHGRLGVSHNFMRLLAQPSDADYFAFCDQDDVWMRDKLQSAVTALAAVGAGPRLYCSAVDYVDSALHPIASSSRPTRPAFNNALVENIAQGCTMVMDAGLRQLIIERLPLQATIHDWWAYLVATAFGTVIYDETPQLLYRQHGGNVVGGGFGFWQKWQKRWHRFAAGRTWQMAAQAVELKRLYPDRLTPEQIDLIDYFVAGRTSFLARLRFLFGGKIWRQSFHETLVIKLLVLINAY